MGFKEKMLKAQNQLKKQYEESINTTDQSGGFSFGSIFIKSQIPEGVGMYKMDVRDHYLDIIPFFAGTQHPKAKKGELVYHVDLWVHRDIGVENDQFVCQKSTWAKPDPICTHIARTRPDKATFKQLASKRRCVYLVYDRYNEDLGLQIFEVSHFFFQKHLDSLMKNPRKGGEPINFAHPTKGKSVMFEYKKSGSFTDEKTGEKRESKEAIGFKFVDRDEPIPDAIFEASFPLDEIIEMHPDERKIEQALDLAPSNRDRIEVRDEEHEDEPEEEEEIEEEEIEEEGEESTSEILEGMDRKELKKFIKENDLEVRVLKSMSDDDIREAILELVEDETEEEEAEEEGEEEEEVEEDEPGERCPRGHVFGEDAEQYPDCHGCPEWDDCTDEMSGGIEEEEEEPEPESKAKPKDTGKKKPPILRKKK